MNGRGAVLSNAVSAEGREEKVAVDLNPFSLSEESEQEACAFVMELLVFSGLKVFYSPAAVPSEENLLCVSELIALQKSAVMDRLLLRLAVDLDPSTGNHLYGVISIKHSEEIPSCSATVSISLSSKPCFTLLKTSSLQLLNPQLAPASTTLFIPTLCAFALRLPLEDSLNELYFSSSLSCCRYDALFDFSLAPLLQTLSPKLTIEILLFLLAQRNILLISTSKSLLAKALAVLPVLARPLRLNPYIDTCYTLEAISALINNNAAVMSKKRPCKSFLLFPAI